VEGETDTRRLVMRLIDEANVGLAPGTAFGAGGEHFVRACFARNPDQLEDAMTRVAAVLSRNT
jgi:aspartate/methionine/tyrosine aminotransferase